MRPPRVAPTLVAVLALATVSLAGGAIAAHTAMGPAILIGGAADAPRDVDYDNVVDGLAIDVPVRVATAGTYRVNVTLQADGWTSRAFNATGTLGVGDRTVTVLVPAPFMRNAGRIGPFTAAAELTGPNGGFLDSNTYLTSSYPVRTWPTAPVGFSADAVVYPHDADGDGRPDGLRLDAPVNVTTAGAYRLRACLTPAGATAATCLPDALVNLTTPGATVTLALPDDLVVNGTPGSGWTARVDLETRENGTALDSQLVETHRYRAEAFTGGADGVSGLAALPVTTGNVSHGLRLAMTAHVDAPQRRDLHVTLLDAPTGRAVTDAATVPRADAPGEVAAALTLDGAAALGVLDGSRGPSMYWRLVDPAGLVVNGGRIDLAGAPTAAIVVDATEPVLLGDTVTLTDASVVPNGVVHARSWTVHGEDAGSDATVPWQASGEGDRAVTLTVRNVFGLAATASATFHVDPNRYPLVRVDDEWSLAEGTNATLALHAEDPDGRAVTWRVVDAPAGVVVKGDRLAWTPTHDAAGEHVIVIAASDGHRVTEKTVRARVADVAVPPGDDAGSGAPTIALADGGAVPGDFAGVEGVPVRLALAATDADGASVPVILEGRPEGATFQDGVFAWESPVAGTHALRFRAGAAEALVVLTVAAAPTTDGAVSGGTEDDMTFVAFVTPAVTAGIAAGVGLVLARRARSRGP